MGWLKTNWQTVAGFALAAFPYLGKTLRFLVDLVGYGGSIDFVLARSSDPGWIGSVTKFLLNLPAPAALLFLLAGVYLILHNERRRSDALYRPVPDCTATVAEQPEELLNQPGRRGVSEIFCENKQSDDCPDLWIGNIHPDFYKVHDDGHLSLFVSIINVSPDDYTILGISGRIIVRYQGEDGKLSPVYLSPLTIAEHHEMADCFPSRRSRNITFYQYVTPAEIKSIFDAADSRLGIVLDLREVRLRFCRRDSTSNRSSLRLWDGLLLRRGSFCGSVQVWLTE